MCVHLKDKNMECKPILLVRLISRILLLSDLKILSWSFNSCYSVNIIFIGFNHHDNDPHVHWLVGLVPVYQTDSNQMKMVWGITKLKDTIPWYTLLKLVYMYNLSLNNARSITSRIDFLLNNDLYCSWLERPRKWTLCRVFDI